LATERCELSEAQHDIASSRETSLRITQRGLLARLGPFVASLHPLQSGDSRAHFLSTSKVFFFVLAVGLFVLAVRDLSDPDLWWHLRSGQLIVETKAVPRTDPFSYTQSGQPWIAHEWLTEVMLYVIYRLAGKAGLVCSFALIISAAFLMTYRRCRGRPYVAGIVTLWGALASVSTWGVRPQMLSLLLTSLFLALLDYSDQEPHLVWWLPVITLAWVNLHAGYAVGITLAVLYLTGSAVDYAFRKTPDKHSVSRLWHLGAATAACLMVVPINPSGARLYLYPIHALRLRVLQYISEWRPPDFQLGSFVLFFMMALGTFVALVLSKRGVRSSQLLTILVTAWAALHSVRHIPIFVMIAIPFLSKNIEELLARRQWAQVLVLPTLNSSPWLRALNGITLLMVLIFAALHVQHTVLGLDEAERRDFPAAAASFLESRHIPEPLLNNYDWGGYLIWRLYPNYHVWVDGRNDLYGDAFMDEYLRFHWAQDGWKQRLHSAGIRSAVLPPNSPLAHSLLQMRDWQRIYEDPQAVILTRTEISK